MKKKVRNTIIILLIILCISSICILHINKENSELKSIKSIEQLSKIYEADYDNHNILLDIVTMPFSLLSQFGERIYAGYAINDTMSKDEMITPADIKNSATLSSSEQSSSKDYSTTNIQVENVDEADITKTDGDYIYSISENNVIITNVINPNDIKIESTIKTQNLAIPEDLILYKNKLVVILSKQTNSRYSTYYNNTIVNIYDITQKNSPILIKNYELYEPYYTSRCIDNELYVIAAGSLRKEQEESSYSYYREQTKSDKPVITYYNEDNRQKYIELDNIKYLKDVKTRKQTLISTVNLEQPKEDINVSSYLIDISNAYVSKNNIYLLNQKYDYNMDVPPVSSLFGIKGVIGAFTYENDNNSNGYYTEIYKFNILENGQVSYDTKTKIKGKTINQYSLDELNGHLRVALYDYEGARIAIFDEKLNTIGTSEYVAKGETMYSSRFINNKAYLVTYKTIDPLFVIDLSNETRPTVLGELKIPGYSTYLHPYDENHLIGIGMETEEVVNRNANGRVISTTARVIGMKMALFDVSDVNNPIQISSTVIGDKRTTSAILTNPKALLFSKEKNLIAIPVNNYNEDFEIQNSNETYSSIVQSYKNYNKSYVAEGYFVYNIDTQNGFNLKGIITHEVNSNKKSNYYSNSKLLRGLYIDNNLYTVSETTVKVNSLENLEQIDELKIK